MGYGEDVKSRVVGEDDSRGVGEGVTIIKVGI